MLSSLITARRALTIYDFRTNVHFTLKQNPMTFIACFGTDNRHQRIEAWSEENPDGRFRRFTYSQIKERDKTSLYIFWIKDKSLADLDSLPEPDVLASEIIDNLETAMENFWSSKLQMKEVGNMKADYKFHALTPLTFKRYF